MTKLNIKPKQQTRGDNMRPLSAKRKMNILDRYICGNWTSFWAKIDKFSKLELLDFIEYAEGQGLPRQKLINKVRRHLED